MKMFQCCTCGHIEFDSAPESCLVCNSLMEAFNEAPEAVNQPADPANLTETEKKHIPRIEINTECGLIPGGSCTDVHVRVGEIAHPMEADHYIRYIDYYLDHNFISRVWLSPEACHPACALHLNSPSGTVTIIENCNVHGNWMNETTI
ncbi:MAG: desulfoferrodoxin family protein [Kiritimatiellia bacterium]